MALLLLLRLPFYIFGDVLTEGDVRYFMLGEKVADGFWMYEDFLTTESILSGLLFGVIDFLFGKSIVAYHILAYLLTVIQVYLFNGLVTANRATLSQTYLPGLFYAILISFFPESFTLSPFLVGQTLLLVAMNYQFNHLEFRVKRDEKIILIGILLGFYSLLIGAASVFILTAVMVFALYTNTVFRRYLLMITGFLLPYFISWGIFEIVGHSGVFFKSLPDLLDGRWGVSSEFLILAAVPALLLIVSIPSSLLGRRFTNYQSSLNLAMLIWGISSVVVFWISSESAENGFILLIPILALYSSHYFIAKRNASRGFVFFIVFPWLLFINSFSIYKPGWVESFVPSESRELSSLGRYENKKVLVLGDNFDPYMVSRSHGSRFFDWELSEEYFTGTLEYFSISAVYDGISIDPPEIIVDEDNLMGRYIDRVPELRERYRRTGSDWVLINN